MESSGDRIAEAQFTGQTPASIGLITRETEPSTDGGKTWAKGNSSIRFTVTRGDVGPLIG